MGPLTYGLANPPDTEYAVGQAPLPFSELGGLAMTATDIIFAGSIPSLYDKYLGSVLFGPYADDLTRRLPRLSAGRVLETAAGTGIVTRALLRSLPASVDRKSVV